MWICMNDAFLSAVQDRDASDRLIVRARAREHIVRTFGEEPEETPDADYRWRISILKRDFAEVVADRVENIDYPNFKNSVKDRRLHAMYDTWWYDHRAYQEAERKPAK